MKKLKLLYLSFFIIAMITANIYVSNFSSTENHNRNISLFQLKLAHAQNCETWEEMTWEDIANYLESIDASCGVINAIGDDTPTDNLFETIHAVCDTLDIIGDPVYEWQQAPDGSYASVQTDDCDGQPNWC